jgi:hypothetical protein
MSLASRRPLPVSSLPLWWPALVDQTTGVVDRALIRSELRARLRFAAPRSTSAMLAYLFGKARAQRRDVIAKAEAEYSFQARRAAERAAFEAEALDTAQRRNFDTALLNGFVARYAFGSLADTQRAPAAIKLYRRALAIAIEHHNTPALIAAE